MHCSEIKDTVAELADPEKASFLSRYFKTGEGQYAEGDVFAGLTVLQSRKIAKKFVDIDQPCLAELLTSKIHEERLIALLILAAKYHKAPLSDKKKIVDFYLKHLKYVNNWDLVDTSAPEILGNWLLTRNRKILYSLASSEGLWEKRVAILSTFALIINGEHEDMFAVAVLLLKDKHDLIHKATGWMLREVGKRIDMDLLRQFLAKHAAAMPRTALRYAIERMDATERKKWLSIR